VAFEVGPPGNWEVVSLDEARRAFSSTVGAALSAAAAEPADIAAAAFGVAGVDWPADEELVAELVRSLELPAPFVVANDAFPALRAGAAENVGCVSSAGTGSVTAGRNAAGETFRTLAVGAGEQSGAGGLVFDALDAIAAAHHGDGAPTALTDSLLVAAGADSVSELFRRIEREGLQIGAEQAPVVLELAAAGDGVAVEIARRAGERLARTAAAVATRLGLAAGSFPLVRAGSVHLAGSTTLDGAFTETAARLVPTGEVTVTRMPPAAGAVLLAIESAARPAPFEAVARHFEAKAVAV
jgi:N-acetylglucosamine kinase-like BadF-type ATPase